MRSANHEPFPRVAPDVHRQPTVAVWACHRPHLKDHDVRQQNVINPTLVRVRTRRGYPISTRGGRSGTMSDPASNRERLSTGGQDAATTYSICALEVTRTRAAITTKRNRGNELGHCANVTEQTLSDTGPRRCARTAQGVGSHARFPRSYVTPQKPVTRKQGAPYA